MMLAAGSAAAQDVDLVVNLTDAGYDPTPAGGTVVYVVSVANNGNDTSTATTLTLNVAAGTTFLGASGTITGCAPTPVTGPATVACNVPALALAASVSANVQIRTTVSGSASLGASVPTAGDTDTSNNADTESTTITSGADIALSMAGPATASSGSTITYTFTATNNGPDPVSNVAVQFPIPTGLSNVVPPAGCSLSVSTYNCTIPGPIAVGGTANLNFQGQISAAAGSNIAAIGSTSGGTPVDPVSTNNNASRNTTVTSGSDLTIAKSRSPSGSLLVGNAVSFTLSPSYTGDSPSNIVVTDTLPANYTINPPVSAPGWTCTVTGQTVSCTRTSGTVAGVGVSLGTITIPATVVSSGSATNTTQITASGPTDPNPANNAASDGGVTIADPTIDLRANKSGPVPALVVTGNAYDFRISTTNDGNSAFFGTLNLTDSLPAGLQATGYALNGWTCLPAASVSTPVVGPATISCSRVYTSAAPLAAGATTPAVVMTTTALTDGTITNTVTTDSPNPPIPDLNPGNDGASYTVTGSDPTASADIRVTKTATLASLPAGDIETFTLSIINDGPTPASSVTLTDNLLNLINGNAGATGAGFIDAVAVANSATGVSCSSVSTGGTSRRLTCTVATLPVCSGASCPEITVRVRPGGNAGGRSNTASVISSVTADPLLTNNSDTETYNIEARADVTVSKTDSPDPATAGQNLTYVITATNIANGLSAADAVTITDTLPSNVTFVSASPSAGTCAAAPAAGSTTSASNNTLSCNLGTIANGAQQTVTVIVRPNLNTRGTTLTNSVSVATSTIETDTTNNSASATTPVQVPVIDLLMNKDDTVDPLAVGDDTVYTVTVTNLGPSAAENVVVTDNMPPIRVAFRSYSAPGDANCTAVPAVDSLNGTLTCSFPVIAAGESRVILVTGRGVAKGTASNTATVSSDETVLGYEPNTGNNQSTEATSVRTRVDMQVASKVATPAVVNLRDPFSYKITVVNNTGPGRAEADDVVLTDALPAGMELTGAPSVVAISGSSTLNTCTGAAGSTAFSCSLGTVTLGAQLEVTVPVRVVSVGSAGQTFTNTASLTTSSLDEVPSNNSNSGPVVVNSSSLAGQVFRDFANDGANTTGDTGISGVVMTLSGTAFDGTPITRTVNTASNGTFTFGLLPQGTYTLTQGTISETYLTNGTTAAGTSGGSVAPTVISGISLGAATAATDYRFPKVPQARIGIAKAVQSGPTINTDGSYTVTFRLAVRNFGLEPLNAVQVTDTLSGSAPLFGSYSATTPTLPGTYTMAAAPSGSCGGLNGGYNGAGSTTVASGFTLAAGASCTINLQLQVMPTNPLPPVLAGGERYRNQAQTEGVGALSGQTKATNAQLADQSDAGTNADANGNGQANEAGENDPTPLPLTLTPGISLIKSLSAVTDTNLDGMINPGDTASYTFTVRNTGQIALANVTVTDPLVAVVGGPISLGIGASDTGSFTASYVLQQADLDRGYVQNTATTNGDGVTSTGAPFLDDSGNPVTVSDVSDSGTNPTGGTVSSPESTETADGTGATDGDPTNDPTVAPLTPAPKIVLEKRLLAVTDTTGDGQIGANDTATYGFTVKNVGPLALANVTVTDPLVAVVGGPISLGIGATDTTTFTASYVLQQADVDRGYVQNTATTTGNAVTSTGTPILDGSGNPILVSDVSDTGTAPDGSAVTTPDVTETPDGAGATDGDPTNDPTVAIIVPGPKVVLVKRLLALTDTNGDGLNNAGDTATYAFEVTNTGTVTLASVTVTDPLVTVTGGPALVGVGTTDSATFAASYVLTQADVDRGYVDNSATVTGTAATVAGTPILDGSGNPILVSDVSDTGTAPDGSTVTDPATTETPSGAGVTDSDPTNDPTALLLAPDPRVTLVKRLVSVTDTTGDGQIGAGDTVAYGFTVTNTGTLALAGVTVTDPLVTVAGGPVSLAIGASDSATFTASSVLQQADVDRGYLQNTATTTGNAVTATGTPILAGSCNPVQATDVSDTGTAPDGSAVTTPEATETPDGAGATDGDPTNDPTVALIAPEPAIRLVKRITGTTDVNGSGYVDLGDVVLYAFEVTNTGSVTLTNVTVNDPMFPVAGGPVTLAVGETNSGVFTGSYTLAADDITRTYVQNSATTSGTASTVAGTPILDGSGNPVVVTDVSDTGTDPTLAPVSDPEATETPDGTGATDDDPTNDPTVIRVGQPEIQLDIAIADITDINGDGIINAGDQIIYTFTVTNTGDVDLFGVNMDYTTLSLPMPGLTCTPISLAIGASQTLTCTGNAYTITAADAAVGTVSLSGTATGASSVGQVVSDDDAVVSPTFGLGGLTITKTVDRGQANPGEVVTYTITVGNSSTNQTTVTDVVDVLPSGFIYQPGTATVNGVATEPVDSGRRLLWQDVSLPPTGTATIVLDVLISASVKPGDHDNVARAISPGTGLAVTPDAVATVRIAADPVFACSTIIGRVFDDLNQDGYYNGEPKEDHSAVTDQTYHGDKWNEPEQPKREKGLPGVRLVAPNGVAVTTDPHGRFSLPCAALPADIGSNFMLKLDTRTLPSGYRLTTENPRVVRVTPGMLTKMNFGATISRVVRVDLSDRAFGTGEAARQPRQELVDGLKSMVAKVADTPTMLRISYQLANGESEKLARQRMREIEKLLRRLWPANGRYQLNVETVIQRSKTVNE